MDRVAELFSQKTPRRLMALAVFALALWSFRHLAILLVFFVSFERALGWSARALSSRTGLPRKKCVLVVVGLTALVLALLAWRGIGGSIRMYGRMHATLPDRLTQLKDHPLFDMLENQVGGTEKIVEGAKHYAGSAIAAASAIGHFLIHVVMGFVLALVYVLEEDEIGAFWSRVDPRSLHGTVARWVGHVADATIVTVQLQLIVAACNTAMTLPVLLILGVPNVGALMLLIFVSALVPVIGNIVSGGILSLLAYQQKGWLGVGLFIGLTFLLHKIESYYLNPRLTSRHVKIPGFLLIISLIACEHVFGFKGLFLSFPILFVAGRIRTEFVEEDTNVASSPIDRSDSPDQLPLSGAPSALDEPTGMELEHAPVRLDTMRPNRSAPTKEPVEKPAEPASVPSAPPPSAPEEATKGSA